MDVVSTATISMDEQKIAVIIPDTSVVFVSAELPSHRHTFTPVPDKPPLSWAAAVTFLENVSKNKTAADFVSTQSPTKQVPEFVPTKTFLAPSSAPRPLQRLLFRKREHPHHSIIMLIDGLLFACFRVRLERDVCASSASESFCIQFGASCSPASTFCGLFLPHHLDLLDTLQAVFQEKGYGVFVGPSHSNAWALFKLTSNKEKLLSFTFTGPDQSAWEARFYCFAYQGKILRKKKDVHFSLVPIISRRVPVVVDAIPFCPARCSSHPHIPNAGNDVSPKSPSLTCMLGVPRPLQLDVWNPIEMAKLAALFPFDDVRSLFTIATSSTGLRLGFVGCSEKHIIHRNGYLESEVVANIHERFTDEVSKNRMAGPFNRCPFPNEWNANQARVTPLDTRRKDKYDPLSRRFRVISNFSAGFRSSINSLIFSPKLISTHLQCAHLRDKLAMLGPNARFDAIDQQDAFRADHIHLDDAHLYCYQLNDEWFMDLRDPFGNVKSEFTYAIIVAVLKWAFENDESLVSPTGCLLGYVDNWFLLSRADCSSHDTRWENLKNKFKLLGAPMHEEQRGSDGIVNALGWDWDLKHGIFSCPVDKHNNCLKLSRDWAVRAEEKNVFNLPELESITGLFQWICTACPAITSSVTCIQVPKHRLKRSGHANTKLDIKSEIAVIDLATFFLSWNRCCFISPGFSPAASWEVLIKVDASTDFGAGGVCIPSFANLIHEWSPSERYDALHHCDEPIRESTCFFELQAIYLMLLNFTPLLVGKRVQIECDNEAAIRTLVHCYSAKQMCMKVTKLIRDLCALNRINPRFEHILGTYNAIADRLSHNDFAKASLFCQNEFDTPSQASLRN